jgi:ribosome-associated protein
MKPEQNAWQEAEPSPAFLVAEAAAYWLLTKKAEDVVLLDLRGRSDVCDFFVVCTGLSDIQTRALARAVTTGLEALGQEPLHTEGLREGRWILLDYVDVIVHCFLAEVRQYYLLERFWGDAPRLQVDEEHFWRQEVRERHSELPLTSGPSSSPGPEESTRS